VTEFERDPISGRLAYGGCITGESRGLGRGNPCRAIPLAKEAGFDSGMWLIERLAISRDGRSLYGAARGDDAIAAFSRNPATGILSYRGHYGSLDEPTDLALSPGGRSLFVAARGDAAILRYSRDPGDGDLTFEGCVTGSRSSAPETGGRCGWVRGEGGAHQLGFGGLSSLALADGGLYATATNQSAISRFAIPSD
jgi:lactonase family protein with 7-bladed beta-propeller